MHKQPLAASYDQQVPCRSWNWFPSTLLPLVGVVGLLLLIGCGGPRTDRLAISGSVTLDGAPLDRGLIRFTSIGAKRLSASGAMIRNGEFNIPREKGLLPGTYHLEISSPDQDAPPIIVRETPDGPGIAVAPDRIPMEYNMDSELTIDVTIDGTNHFVFEIASQSAG